MIVEAPALPIEVAPPRFTSAQLAQLDFTRLPRHVAIIPDGNRRWAKKHLSSSEEGHREGADILMEIVKAAKDLGIQVITFYVFSTENWNRSPAEVTALMALFGSYLVEQRLEMLSNGIKLETIGSIDLLPPFLKEIISDTKEATQHCHKISLVLALNYGARDEMCRAIQRIVEDCEKNVINKTHINPTLVSRYLDTRSWQDPELLIRTSGEYRLSNFLLWQISYTEVFVSPVLWPDFKPSHLFEALLDYQNRERRLGGNS